MVRAWWLLGWPRVGEGVSSGRLPGGSGQRLNLNDNQKAGAPPADLEVRECTGACEGQRAETVGGGSLGVDEGQGVVEKEPLSPQ